jgi:hypothetical protein
MSNDGQRPDLGYLWRRVGFGLADSQEKVDAAHLAGGSFRASSPFSRESSRRATSTGKK